jgi:MFS family permease
VATPSQAAGQALPGSDDGDSTPEPVGYWTLIRSNRNFRLLWMGDVISFFGDWFNTIAMYAIVERLTGSPFALGLVFVTKMLPMGLASPVAGLIADRFNRRKLMIISDLARAVVVLGFLLVRDAGDLPLLYTLAVLQVAIGAVFIPARGASIPNITTPQELVTANTLMAATWSTILAIGAGLGGFATDLFGEHAVFVIDSLSYVVSGALLIPTVIPQKTDVVERGRGILLQAAKDIKDGWKHLHIFPAVGRITLAKSAWALGGGGLVFMLAVLGGELMPASPAVGIGILFSVRGLGTGIGPILARRWFLDERTWPAVLGACLAVSGIFYLGVGVAPWSSLILISLLIAVAHALSGANWVLSNVMLQKRTVDNFRGRVFSTELLLLTVVNAISIVSASVLLEADFISLRGCILVFAAVTTTVGFLWLLKIVPAERAWFKAS